MLTKGDSSHDGDHDKTAQEPALSDAHMEAFQRRKMILRAATDRARIPLGVVLRAVWLELCSLISRIVILRRNNWFPHGVSLDQFAQEDDVPYPLRCKYRRARIRGIQKVRSIHSGATLVDFHILVSAIDPQLFLEDRGMGGQTTQSSQEQDTGNPCTTK
jgi:hypothetical protein